MTRQLDKEKVSTLSHIYTYSRSSLANDLMKLNQQRIYVKLLIRKQLHPNLKNIKLKHSLKLISILPLEIEIFSYPKVTTQKTKQLLNL